MRKIFLLIAFFGISANAYDHANEASVDAYGVNYAKIESKAVSLREVYEYLKEKFEGSEPYLPSDYTAGEVSQIRQQILEADPEKEVQLVIQEQNDFESLMRPANDLPL